MIVRGSLLDLGSWKKEEERILDPFLKMLSPLSLSFFAPPAAPGSPLFPRPGDDGWMERLANTWPPLPPESPRFAEPARARTGSCDRQALPKFAKLG